MTLPQRLRIVLVDDDRLITTSLKIIIEADPELQVIATATDGASALGLYQIHQPDLILLDIRMPEMSGLEAGKQILAADPEARILYLTTFADDEYIAETLRIGARGYILKQQFESLVPAIKAIQAGQSVFGEEISSRIPSLLSTDLPTDLTEFDIKPKEMDIISLVADGLNNREIATKLHLGEGTVRNSISQILEKLELRDRTQLAIFYHKHSGRRNP
ncbi:MAG: response regulator transcription factor [Ruminococcaceae bacterium]|nr:response regulator transcription factor [Oscillospiraceae bacterium]